MRALLAVYRRELALYFISPIAYIVMAAFLFVIGFIYSGELVQFVTLVRRSGGAFSGTAIDVNSQLLTPYFFNVAFVGLFLFPLVTMRLLAEERRAGTMELLLTYPITDLQVVAGKYLAALTLYVLMLAGSTWTTAVLIRYGNPDLPPVILGYAGVFLYGAAFLALGLMLSSLTENQIVAAALSFVLFLVLWLLHWASTLTDGTLSDVLRYVSIVDHFQAMSQGILNTSDLIFFGSVIFFGLYVALLSLAARRWSGA